ncbi:lipopolysaccharide transport periplasmic protein LptA [Paucibacter sp. Y2R2-4]|uniref:lipopolysaccharide transport periplasmic protein LptA n=1 Tax=Paucibacter sp. Y2R2-4 TaxID=2893553 RepID=UPI0021E36E0C|nr:lipopolysaccharide transport periplasmic protein LptA [Paucibacter sp. Y2R2-4]MCV2351380.1 lipopolysaccharide transport periplasmic protein LptA [Paucibacter sp. Y2R2-4]
MKTAAERLLQQALGLGLAALLILSASSPALAEKADRLKPLNIASEKGGRIDVANQRTEFLGDVVLSKGSILLRAERVDLRETGDGYYQAYANGQTGKQVSFRQARDVPGEAIEGFADQIEYDTRSDAVRFIGNAVVRRTVGTSVGDEVTGAVIVYDNRSEVFTVEGGQSSPHPSGRVRVVMMPRGEAASGSTDAKTPALPLKPSTELQPPRKPS